MNKYIPILLLAMSSSVVADTLEGCYSEEVTLTSFTSDETSTDTNYIHLTKQDGKYYADGRIWGANYHTCWMGSPVEASNDPLTLTPINEKLVFEASEPEWDIDCKLELSVEDGVLLVSDDNFHCSRYMFTCGARVSWNQTKLPYSGKTCS